MRFLSTPSARRATRRVDRFLHSHRISIHALREEGDAPAFLPASGGRISIHALREEGDPVFSVKFRREYISIHALREEGDAVWAALLAEWQKFLSTPSARRATHHEEARRHREHDFYPRPPRGGRRARDLVMDIYTEISIHALREEGDLLPAAGPGCDPRFLSTPSARRATPAPCPPKRPSRYFYPRPPRGGRQIDLFQLLLKLGISIHALREEGDTELDSVRRLFT